MKFLLYSFVLISSANAFLTPQQPRLQTFLSNQKIDSSDAISAALEATKKHGATSKEARIAWEAVEEMDSSDNSAAYSSGVSGQELHEKTLLLSKLLGEQKTSISLVKSLAKDLSAIKIADPDSLRTVSKVDSEALATVLSEAKEATEKFGADSVEAKLAWETVEEVASNDFSEVIKPSFAEECLVEAIEACEALEELDKALSKRNKFA